MRCAPDIIRRQAACQLVCAALLTLACSASAAPAAKSGKASLPANLGAAFEQSLNSRFDLRLAQSKIENAALEEASRKSVLWPQVYLGWSGGIGKSPGTGQAVGSLPVDVNATVSGVPLDRSKLESIARGTLAPPAGLRIVLNGREISLAELQQSLAVSPSPLLSGAQGLTNYQQGLSIGASYTLYSGGVDARSVKAAALQSEDARQDRLVALAKAFDEVSRAYFQLRLALMQEQFDSRTLGAAERKLADMASQFEAGHLSAGDYQNAQLQLEMQRLLAQKNQLDTSARRQAYCVALGLSPCPQLEPQSWLAAGSEAVPEWVNTLIEESRGVAHVKTAIARTLRSYDEQDARSAYLPRVSIGVSTGAGGFSSSSFADALQKNRYTGWQLGLSVSWTLFDGFRAPVAVRQARQRSADNELLVEQSLSANADEKLRLRIAVQQASLACRTAQLQVRLAADKLAHERIRHGYGVIATHTLLDAEMKLDEADFGMQKLQLEAHQADLNLRFSGQPEAQPAAASCDVRNGFSTIATYAHEQNAR